MEDWKSGNHKYWCGKAGEKNVDFKIAAAGGSKGLGVFAMRDFKNGDKIIVERPAIIAESTRDLPTIVPEGMKASVSDALLALVPQGGSFHEKLLLNTVSISDEEGGPSGVFVNISRVNHNCIGSSDHYFLEQHNLMLLVASIDIEAGSEITFSYVHYLKTKNRSLNLKAKWGIICNCRACTMKDVQEKLERAFDLDERILTLGRQGKSDYAIRTGTQLLKLHEQLHVSSRKQASTYYELFQFGVLKRATLKKALFFIQKAVDHAKIFYSCECEVVRKYTQLKAHPELHRNYLLLDGRR